MNVAIMWTTHLPFYCSNFLQRRLTALHDLPLTIFVITTKECGKSSIPSVMAETTGDGLASHGVFMTETWTGIAGCHCLRNGRAEAFSGISIPKPPGDSDVW